MERSVVTPIGEIELSGPQARLLRECYGWVELQIGARQQKSAAVLAEWGLVVVEFGCARITTRGQQWVRRHG